MTDLLPETDRPPDDDYPTPPPCVRALLAVEAWTPGRPIWEPCAGAGHLAKTLRAAGHLVSATTLHGYHRSVSPVAAGYDACTVDAPAGCDVITNPPFKFSESVIRNILRAPDVERAAFLMPLSFLSGQRRGKGLFVERPPARVWVISDRVTMYPGSWGDRPRTSGKVPLAWYVWTNGHTGPFPPLGWVNTREF